MASERERKDEKKIMMGQQSHEIKRRAGDEEPTWPLGIRLNDIHSPKIE